jgi:hypothetical protein
MQKRFAFLLLLLSTPLFAQQTPSLAPGENSPTDPGAFTEVIAQVTNALQEYQAHRGTGDYALPPLSSAEFDFKTTTTTKDGFTFQILVFKFGSDHEKDVTNDVTFTYSLPTPRTTRTRGLGSSKEPPTLESTLANTIQSAAKSIVKAPTIDGVPFSKLTISLQFGVDWKQDPSGQFTYSIVTVGLTDEKDKNTIQSVKLVFGK